MGFEIINHGLEIDLLFGKFTLSNQFMPDAFVVPAVMRGVADGLDLPARHANFGGSLNMHDVDFKRIGKPYQLMSGKHAGFFDIRPARVLLHGAVRAFPAQDRSVRTFDQIDRSLIQRIPVTVRPYAGTVKNRRVISCVQDSTLVITADRNIRVKFFS